MKKVFLETFGCQMNVSDSERVATTLSARGYEITPSQMDADVVLINTCSVREKAEQKLYTQVGRIRKNFKKKPVVGVMGCVAQLEGETVAQAVTVEPERHALLGQRTGQGALQPELAQGLRTVQQRDELTGRKIQQ